MNLQMVIENNEIHFNNPDFEKCVADSEDIGNKFIEFLIIQLYREAKLSIGQVSGLFGISVYEAMEWMNERGVYKMNSLNPEVRKITENSRIILEKELKEKFNKQ